MFTNRLKLFRLLGFTVYVDASWLLLAILIVWTLAAGYFPQFYEELGATAYWVMGAFGAVGLFVSIILHELAHSVVARRYGIPLRGITLFIFGGVAEMDREPPSAKSEFFMAIAGPIMSLVIGAACYGLWTLGSGTGLPLPVAAVVNYLAWINIVLAVFNMVPAFPLDGGRVFRAAVWHFTDNIRKATRISSAIGSAFGVALIVLGVIGVLGGNIVGGIWWVLIGIFVRGASQMSYQQVLIRGVFEGEPVSHFMRKEPVTVGPQIPVDDFVENYVYRHHYKMFPVVEGDKLTGCVTTQALKELPRETWSNRTVGDVARECSPENTIGPNEDTMKALTTMQRNNQSRLMVVDEGRLVGVVSLKDLLRFLSLKLDLEQDEQVATQA